MNYIISLVSFQFARRMLQDVVPLTRRQAATVVIGDLLAQFCVSSAIAAPEDDFKDASKLYQQSKFDQAMAKVNNGLQTQPKDAQGRFLKGC